MSETRAGRAIRLLGHPAAPPALLVVLVFDALLLGASVAHRSPRNNRSVVGTWIADTLRMGDRVRVQHSHQEFEFVRSSTGDLIWVTDDEYAAVRDAPLEAMMGRLLILSRSWKDGWYAPTSRSHGLDVRLYRHSATDHDEQEIMATVEDRIEEFAADLYNPLSPPYPPLIPRDPNRYTMERSSPRPIGWIHNALTATVAMAFLVSLGMMAWRGVHRFHRTIHE